MLEFALSKYSYHKSYLGEVEMENPSGHNGFYTKECWLMNIVCVFLIFIFTLNIGSVILTPFRKGKELTVENYREYININTYSAEIFNSDEYIVQIYNQQKDVYDFKITVEIRCTPLFGEESYTKEFSFSDAKLSKSEKLEQKYTLPNHMYHVTVGKVLSIEGSIK